MRRTVSIEVELEEFDTEALIEELCDRASAGDEEAMRFVTTGSSKRTDTFVSTAAIAGLFGPPPTKQKLQELMDVPAIGLRAQNLWRKGKAAAS